MSAMALKRRSAVGEKNHFPTSPQAASLRRLFELLDSHPGEDRAPLCVAARGLRCRARRVTRPLRKKIRDLRTFAPKLLKTINFSKPVWVSRENYVTRICDPACPQTSA